MNDESDEQDDKDLFRQAMRGVTPLKPDNRVRHNRPPQKARPHRQETAADDPQPRFPDEMRDETCPDQLYFVRPGGPQKSVLKKMRAGKLDIDRTLDLHGLSVDAARRQLIDFLDECERSGYRHVIIVHGKGFRSQNRPVIKPMVNRWLQQADEVLAFCSAQPRDGGTGAVYVLLRKTRSE